MAHELPKTYDPAAIEQRWADFWLAERLFDVAAPQPGDPTPVFTILLPPPNVTGRLHMGHMLNQTEMDIIVRWKRMSGFKALWVPGTDHAGIATQMMVERQLATESTSRQKLGREKFIERVWEWKQLYGGAIMAQMKRLGVSVDWSREYFTMDERLSRAVKEAFVRLYQEGLIYRGLYIVNWCPRCMTAISDLEVAHEETNGKLYEIRYPLVDGSGSITVATTRPETMLGDTAVAVNPNDKRYKHLIGKKVRLPLLSREIPIIGDEWANPEFGTGAVKVTPAHDPNDFAIGQRHNLPSIVVMEETAHMNENAGPFAGMDRFVAREQVLSGLAAIGLLAGEKPHMLAIGKCTRCGTVVEPRLSMQWFIKIQPLADKAIAAVRDGEINFSPQMYAKTYFEWMNNIHDWCISRQLWWGHRIPAWRCADCGKDTVSLETPERCENMHCASDRITQETDVLDTWFSSGLLPFTVFGWPEKTRDLEAFYPTSLLITGFDILFFWVARMIMLGCHFMEGHPQGRVPFREVYIHALVRDAERQKMSKTKGNVVDPIEVTEKYGTDAVRFTLASLAAPGTDIAFNADRVDGYRAFANKIWNAARFIFMNVDRAQESGAWSLLQFQTLNVAAELLGKADSAQLDSPAAASPRALEDRWIISRLNRVAQQVNDALADYRFHEAAHVIYHFFWGEFCDWYLEIIKLRLNQGEDDRAKAATRDALNHLVYVFEAALRLLSPFMPFITEEIWQAIYDQKPPVKSIAVAVFPQSDAAWLDAGAESAMAVLQALVSDVRTLRVELKMEPKQKAPVQIYARPEVQTVLQSHSAVIERLCNAESLQFAREPIASQPNARVSPEYEVRVLFERKVDVSAERGRLTKELDRMQRELAGAQRQLSNEAFLSKAPAQVVEGLKRKQQELGVLIQKTQEGLDQLQG